MTGHLRCKDRTAHVGQSTHLSVRSVVRQHCTRYHQATTYFCASTSGYTVCLCRWSYRGFVPTNRQRNLHSLPTRHRTRPVPLCLVTGNTHSVTTGQCDRHNSLALDGSFLVAPACTKNTRHMHTMSRPHHSRSCPCVRPASAVCWHVFACAFVVTHIQHKTSLMLCPHGRAKGSVMVRKHLPQSCQLCAWKS